MSRLLFGKRLVSAERILHFFRERYAGYGFIAFHYVWEDLFWRRKHERIEWLEKGNQTVTAGLIGQHQQRLSPATGRFPRCHNLPSFRGIWCGEWDLSKAYPHVDISGAGSAFIVSHLAYGVERAENTGHRGRSMPQCLRTADSIVELGTMRLRVRARFSPPTG